jgi:hypothetical protein
MVFYFILWVVHWHFQYWEYIALDDRMTDELERKGSGHVLNKAQSHHLLGETEEDHENLGQDNWWPGWDTCLVCLDFVEYNFSSFIVVGSYIYYYCYHHMYHLLCFSVIITNYLRLIIKIHLLWAWMQDMFCRCKFLGCVYSFLMFTVAVCAVCSIYCNYTSQRGKKEN